jgi:hypothetical protein
MAAMANAARKTGALPCPIVRCRQERAGERMDFIIPASIRFFKKFSIQKKSLRAIP